MTEELEDTLPAVDPAFLDHTKRITMERVISHMNAVGASIVSSYPMAEVQSWTIQRLEAEAILATTSPSLADVTSMTPFLLAVCEAHYGEVVDATDRVSQVLTKAAEVKANADLWAALSAFVNGLRARTSDLIEAATSIEGVFEVESGTASELSAFRTLYGV